ncbi:MAG: hypothetical protein Kow00120_12740 [Anaerolineae bacterium]
MDFFVGDPLPPAPTPQQPVGTLYQNAPTFQWSAAQYATHYRLYVEGTGGAVLNQLYTVGVEVTCAGGACTVDPGLALADGAYAWWVQGSNATGRGPWSARADFTVDAVPDAPVPQQPVGTITDANPTYSWSQLPNATHYELYVTGLGGAYLLNQTYAVGAEVTCAGGTCQVTPADVLATGDYRWWARGVNNGVAGAWPARTDFTVAP